MKIISKYKDYYDYFQGIYGVDYNRIYKREDYILKPSYSASSDEDEPFRMHTFAINNKLYYMAENEKGMHVLTPEFIDQAYPKKRWIASRYKDYISEVNTDINRIKRKPILYQTYRWNQEWQNGDPILKSFDFHKVMSAKDVYLEVESFMGWLKDNPPIPDKMTDKEKTVSHGFDLKKSFRHRK